MALRYREEIVGKRFLCAFSRGKLQLATIAEWPWRNGIIRAASHSDSKHEELAVLVEFDDVGWKGRKWIHVYDKNKFQVFLIENTLVWTYRKDPYNSNRPEEILWPAFSFKPLVDVPGVSKSPLRPVECLVDGTHLFLDYDRLIPYQDGDVLKHEAPVQYGDVKKTVRKWIEQQDGQAMLLTTPSVLFGYRVEVYRVEGTTQWYTAVIGSYNDTTRELTLTDDTVLEVHNEDPSLVQMRLIGDGVVESIRKGESVGVTPRRRTCTLNNQHGGHYTRSTRSHSQSPHGGGNVSTNNARNSKKNNKRSSDCVDDNEKVTGEKSASSRINQERKRKTSESSDVTTSDASHKKERASKKSKVEEGKKQKNKDKRNQTKEPEKNGEIDKEAMADDVRHSDDIPVDVKAVSDVIKASADDHCSDSGISDKSGIRSSDERSTSRSSESSRLSDDRITIRSGDEHGELRMALKSDEMMRPRASPAASPLTFDRSEPVNVWRDPKLVKNEISNIRHLHSIQHPAVAPHHPDNPHAVMSASSPARPPGPYPTTESGTWHQYNKYAPPGSTTWNPLASEDEPIQIKREREEDIRERERKEMEEKMESHRAKQREAVHQHFEESLRLASQKKANAGLNQGHDLSVKNSSTSQRSMYLDKVNEQRDNVARMPTRPGDSRDRIPMQSHGSFPEEGMRKHEADAWLRHGQLPQVYHSPELRNSSVQQQMDYKCRSGIVADTPSTVGSLILSKSEPSFSLYGYQPFQHAYITQDKLSLQGKTRQPTAIDHHPSSYSPLPSSTSGGYRHMPLPSPPPLLPSHDSRTGAQNKNSVMTYPPTMSPKQQIKIMQQQHPEQRNTSMQSAHSITGATKSNFESERAHFTKEQWQNSPVAGKPNTPQLPSTVISVTTTPYSNHVYTNAVAAGNTRPTSAPAIAHKVGQATPSLIQQGLVPNPMYNVQAHSSAQRSGHNVDVGRLPTTVSPLNSIPVRGVVVKQPALNLSQPASDAALSRLTEQRYPEFNRVNMPDVVQKFASRPYPESNRDQHADVQNYMGNSASMQTQPLNLEIPNRQRSNACSDAIKRKAARDVNNRKKPKTGELAAVTNHSVVASCSNPVLSRVSAPTPLVSGGVTTITTVVNTIACNPNVQNGMMVQVTSSMPSDVITSSAVSARHPMYMNNNFAKSVNSSSSTTVPYRNILDRPVENEHRASPSAGGGFGAVTKLKKTWLQRHSDEDSNNNKNQINNISNNIDDNEKKMGLNYISSDAVASSSSATTSRFVQIKDEPATPNGHMNDNTMIYTDESTNSASESEFHMEKEAQAAKKALNQKNKKQNCQEGWEQVRVKNEGGEGKIDAVHQPKKRGRKPKIKPDSSSEKALMTKIKSGESFLQNGPCCEVAPKLNRCRECRIMNTRNNKKMLNIFCRFVAFRKLRISKNATMANAGFADPNSEVSKDDLKLWLPQANQPLPDLDLSTSKFILSHVGNQFCGLVQQEQEANTVHVSPDKTIAWKRVVQGVREMCDVCETTLFNFHWACGKCGFVVCIDCYKARKNSNYKMTEDEEQNSGKDRDMNGWLFCNNRQPHEQEKLMLTQIIAGNVLWEVGKLVHTVRKKWNIAMHCNCVRNEMETWTTPPSNGICKQLMSAVKHCFDEKKKTPPPPPPPAPAPLLNGVKEEKSENLQDADNINGNIKQEYNSDEASSSLRWLADVALNTSGKFEQEPVKEQTEIESKDSNEEHFSTLRELLIRPSGKNNNKTSSAPITPRPRHELNTLDDVINCMIEQSVNKQDEGASREDRRLRHYMRRYPQPRSGWDPLPIRIFTLSESRLLFPNVPHSWLCEGRLLRLHDPIHKNNLNLFQEQWKRGQPVLVSEVNRALDMSLWHPEAFARDFGDITNDLVNCHNGNIVPDQPMRKFWEGFENLTKRMQDENGDHMLLKLKDWPPGDDFSELLPSRFEDLMKALPLPEYTHRNGRLNLAGRLPDCFVRPDLGPKMYNAYGSALYPSKGTTNLHLDISDAVNVMVYVGVPRDGNSKQHIEEALKAIDEAGCDILTRRRVRERNERPGALWHIYNARDADKIRDLLNKVAIERGETLEPHHDPIHDQSWYLDAGLRERLYLEYGVEGYAIAQCLGDAVFIPAGAPHQVRNLHSCIKVAEDFVSPENVSHCFTLTQEFRDLSDTHTNHEDKLQVKNIIYHAVKDALSVLLANDMEIPSK